MSRDAAMALLRWHADIGVDALLSDAPADCFAQADAARVDATPRVQPPAVTPFRAAPAPMNAPRSALGMVDPAVALISAREAAAAANTLDELRAAMDAFDGCALKQMASRLVFADGNPQARVMLVGEAPGAEEDRAGVPFVGRSGQLLDRMLASIGLDRTSVYVANVVPWRPPGNRTPASHEVAVCKPFIARQIELSHAQILICIGAPSAQALMGISEGILKARGKWTTYTAGERTLRAMATLHPAYLLRQPAQKKYAWRDLLALRKALDEVG